MAGPEAPTASLATHDLMASLAQTLSSSEGADPRCASETSTSKARRSMKGTKEKEKPAMKSASQGKTQVKDPPPEIRSDEETPFTIHQGSGL